MADQTSQAYSCMGFGWCFSFFAVFLKATVHLGSYTVTGKLLVFGKYCYFLSGKDFNGLCLIICIFYSYGKNEIS